MCLATVYVERDGDREEVMQDVAWIRTERRGLRLIGFMGQDRLVEAQIKDIDLVKSAIVLVGANTNIRRTASVDQQD